MQATASAAAQQEHPASDRVHGPSGPGPSSSFTAPGLVMQPHAQLSAGGVLHEGPTPTIQEAGPAPGMQHQYPGQMSATGPQYEATESSPAAGLHQPPVATLTMGGLTMTKADGSQLEMNNPAHWMELSPITTVPLKEVPGGEEGGQEEDMDDDEDKPLVTDKELPPTIHKWNLWPLFLLLWFLGGAAYYFYIRITQLNGLYGAVILGLEVMGLTSFFPYSILITRGIYPSGSPGLPPAKEAAAAITTSVVSTPVKGISETGRKRNFPISKPSQNGAEVTPMYLPLTDAAHLQLDASTTAAGTNRGSFVQAGTPYVFNPQSDTNYSSLQSSAGYRFHVRVLIPCYKEPLKVVANTLEAAMEASLPANTRRTIYLCDDGNDPLKQQLVESLGPDVIYVSGRKRKVREINGKSANLNNCLKNYVFVNYPRTEKGEIDWTEISNREIVVVFDADMCAKPEFFLRMLEVMTNDDYALCLSPQSFHNISADADLFNNINQQFWECWLPGAFAWGYIACTGTNFCIRARALAHCGWFPDYTITEDYALGMELKCHGYKATYLMLYLAVGEAPDEIRNVFRQRSRWNKGHFQVFFSRRNPLINLDLPFFQRLWYSYAAWAPICTIVSVPTFMVVPFMSIFFGFNPVTITFEFVLSSTIYYTALAMTQNYSHTRGGQKLMWFANGSNTVLWFTYIKALLNSLMAKLGMKVMAFKVTEKVKPQGEAATLAALQARPTMLQRMANAVGAVGASRRVAPQDQPLLLDPAASAPLAASASPGSSASLSDAHSTMSSSTASPTTMKHPAGDSVEGDDKLLLNAARADSSGMSKSYTTMPMGSYVRNHSHVPGGEHGVEGGGWVRFKAVVKSFKPAHIKEFDEMFDPLILLALFLFSAVTFGFGLWQAVLSINQRAPASFALGSPMKGSPYLIISTAWAFCNCIFPYLFLHYCITAGPTFKMTARLLMIFNHIVLAGSIALIWFLIPKDFNLRDPLDLQLNNYFPSQIASDATNNIQLVVGLNATPVNFSIDPVFIKTLSSRLAAVNQPATGGFRRSRSLAEDITFGLFDPVAVSDEELNAPGEVAAWQRSLLQAANATDTAAAALPAGLDISGGLLVKDHVKYAQPMGYAITQLAWALQQFPKGFTIAERQTTLNVIKSGAEYLIRCLVKKQGVNKFAFIAQVGDARDYNMVVDHMTTDPASTGKIWTAPDQDPYLNGAQVRKAWILDEKHVGADLLANVVAALAATAEVFSVDNPPFAALSLAVAKQIHEIASIGQPFMRPVSYCEYVPCWANLTVTKDALTVPQARVPNLNIKGDKPECYYVDWVTYTCHMLWTSQDCTARLDVQREVFKTKSGCCSLLTSLGVWNELATRSQGICSVPDNQYTCYIPDSSQRTCHVGEIDPLTGWGCSGHGLEIYATPLACCNYLITKKFIDAENGLDGSGLCSKYNIDPSFQTCYVPSVSKATCLVKNGTDCDSFGAQTSFDDMGSCCNHHIPVLLGLGIKPLGECKLPENGTLPSFGQAQALPGSAVQAPSLPPSNPPRRALAQAPAPAAQAPPSPGGPTIDAFWVPPTFQTARAALNCTSDNDCNLRSIADNYTVTFYNSTSTLDDMAWAGVWLYRASLDQRYLGEAQRYLNRHYQEDITAQTLTSDRGYYVSDWNNLAWATNALLLQLTGSKDYDDRIRTLLNSWVFNRDVQPPAGLPRASSSVNVTLVNTPANWTDPITNTSYYLVPTCLANASYELNCFDGVDNDCDGMVDREDVDCGLFPVVYTPENLAYSRSPALPNSAAISWLSMVYAERRSMTDARRLRCWALGQVAYMMGATPGTRSYIVGYDSAPGVVNHRASSCPPSSGETEQICNWDNAFWPTTPNPQDQLVKGALLAGPDKYDQFTELRINPDTEVSLDSTVPLTGVLAGLLQTGTGLRSCELMHGLYQRWATEESF